MRKRIWGREPSKSKCRFQGKNREFGALVMHLWAKINALNACHRRRDTSQFRGAGTISARISRNCPNSNVIYKQEILGKAANARQAG